MQRWLLVVVSCVFFVAHTRAQSPADCAPNDQFQSGLHAYTISVDDLERTYWLYLPTVYDGTTKFPIVFSFHGFAGDATQQIGLTDFNRLAEQAPFLAVYPEGTGQPQRWYSGVSQFQPTDSTIDAAFFVAMLDTFEANLCVDSQRVYVSGFSAGGGMTYRLGCELADRITAIGTVSGAYSQIPDGCKPARPVPTIAFHGQIDPIVPYTGFGVFLPPIQEWVQAWATRNNCASDEETPFEGVTLQQYRDCQDGAEVVFYALAKGGHSWFGTPMPDFAGQFGGETPDDFVTSDIMWEFFSRFALNTP